MIENAAFLIGPWWGSWVCPMNMKIHFTSAVQVPVASRVTLQLKFQRCYLFFWGRGGCDVGRCSGPGIAQPHAASTIPPKPSSMGTRLYDWSMWNHSANCPLQVSSEPKPITQFVLFVQVSPEFFIKASPGFLIFFFFFFWSRLPSLNFLTKHLTINHFLPKI